MTATSPAGSTRPCRTSCSQTVAAQRPRCGCVHARSGLDQLTRGLVEWMPRISEEDLEPIMASEPGDTEAARELERMLAELGYDRL